MSEIGIFREGGLPPFPLSYLKIDLRILRCSYWNVYYWQHDTLIAPYWRIYRNRGAGASISLKGESWDLDEENIFLIPPNTPFSSTLNLNAPRKDRNFLMGCPVSREDRDERPLESVRHFFLHFTAGLPCDRLAPGIYRISSRGEAGRLIDFLEEKLSGRDNILNRSSIFSIRALIDLLLASVPEEHWPGEVVEERVQKVLDHIAVNYLNPLRVADLASLVNMSENGFSRLFRKVTGTSPHDYLIERRLEQACNLLHHSDFSIDQIAVMSGFCDRAYFSRMFIRRYSTGPAKFRKTAFIESVQK